MKVHYQIINGCQLVFWIGKVDGEKFLGTYVKEGATIDDVKEMLKFLASAEFEEGQLRKVEAPKVPYVR